MARHGYKRGCLIGNLGQEVESLPDGFRQQLVDVFLAWQERVSSCLEAAQEKGSLSREAVCDELAVHFWVGWEGAVSRAKLVQSSSPLDQHLQHFLRSLPA